MIDWYIYSFTSGEFEGQYKSLSDFPDPSLGVLNVSSHPTSPLITCSGRARDWPESRGIFRNKDNTFVVFVNEDDHVQFRCFDKGGNLQGVFDKLIRGIAAFERELKRSGEEFMWDDHLGYIVSDPIHLGTALDVRARVKLHHLASVSHYITVLLFKKYTLYNAPCDWLIVGLHEPLKKNIRFPIEAPLGVMGIRDI